MQVSFVLLESHSFILNSCASEFERSQIVNIKIEKIFFSGFRFNFFFLNFLFEKSGISTVNLSLPTLIILLLTLKKKKTSFKFKIGPVTLNFVRVGEISHSLFFFLRTRSLSLPICLPVSSRYLTYDC